MKRILLAGAAALGLATAACQSTGGVPPATVVSNGIAYLANSVNGALLAVNTALAQSAPSIASIVADIQVADGYFQQLAPKLSPAQTNAENKIMAVVNTIAANPPSSVAAAVGALAAAKTNVQNLSTAPSAAPIAVVVAPVPATPVSPAIPSTTVTVPAAAPTS